MTWGKLPWRSQEILRAFIKIGVDRVVTARDLAEHCDLPSSSIGVITSSQLVGEYVEVVEKGQSTPKWKPNKYKLLPVNLPDYLTE